jgi:hypothetical protein
VIYLSDHLSSDRQIHSPNNIVFKQTENIHECEILPFTGNSSQVVSREEVGKWVDKLMEIPDGTELNFKDVDFRSEDLVDPLTQVAEKILNEESI